MEEFNQSVLQQAGVIPSLSKDISVCPSSDNENNSSDTSSDVDRSTDNKEEQDIEPSNNIEHDDSTVENNTLPANNGTLLLDAAVAEVTGRRLSYKGLHNFR